MPVPAFFHLFLVLRQDEVPAGDLPGEQIHNPGFQPSCRRGISGHQVQVNGNQARVRVQGETCPACQHSVLAAGAGQRALDITQQQLL